MKFKNILTLLVVFSLSLNFSFAQKRVLVKADKLYNNFNYIEAIKQYEQISNKTPEVYQKLATSYRLTNNTIKSEEYYALLSNSRKITAQDVYFYSATLQSNNKFDEAREQMKIFNSLQKKDGRAKKYLNNFGSLSSLQNDEGRFIIKNLKLNTKNDDFSAVYYKNTVVFASTNMAFQPIQREWTWNHLPFLNIYTADLDSAYELVNVKYFDKKLNKKYHEGPASFAKNGKFMAYTRNNYEEVASDDIVRLKIFFREMKDSSWLEPVGFHLNSSEYSVGQPALTADGNTMYFVSDIEGGFGETDIYYVVRDTSGNWSKPINMGDKINTEGKEMFPFIHKNGMLFFSSDGHLTLGGLDIFYTQLNNNIPNDIINLAYPVNDHKDDFGFVISDDLLSGFFSSNRDGGKGNDDLYSFRMLKPFGKILKGITIDDSGNILANTQVILFDFEKNPIDTVLTNNEGKFSFIIYEDNDYNLTGEKDKYINAEKSVSSKGTEKEIYTELILPQKSNISVVWVVTDSITRNPIPNASLAINNIISEEQYNLITDENGKVKIELKDAKINDPLKYNYKVNKDQYIVISRIYDKNIVNNSEILIPVTLLKLEVGIDLSDIININPIYFDYTKHNIRPDAAIELDKIVKVMNDNPTMVIELSSHTDCRGSNNSNISLSDRRAKSSANYIKKRITNPQRIYGKGYGETKIINKCKDGVKCNEDEHQINRRTEFKIIKM